MLSVNISEIATGIDQTILSRCLGMETWCQNKKNNGAEVDLNAFDPNVVSHKIMQILCYTVIEPMEFTEVNINIF